MHKDDEAPGDFAPVAGPFRFGDPHHLLETHLARTSRGAHWIYRMVLVLVIGGFASLPLVAVDVYVSAAGILRPALEKPFLEAVVSPNSDLVAEVLVAPSDIGFIRIGEPVLLRIHAFNAQKWGVLNARVESIGSDVVDAEAGPAFRVRASIDRSYLELPNGHRGNLRDGMTFEARFLVARRTLFQLLRGRAHDWILSPVTVD